MATQPMLQTCLVYFTNSDPDGAVKKKAWLEHLFQNSVVGCCGKTEGVLGGVIHFKTSTSHADAGLHCRVVLVIDIPLSVQWRQWSENW
jgi:hypothetical protein